MAMWFLARLAEPSTWLGLSMLMSNLSAVVTHAAHGDYSPAVGVAGGVLGVLMREGK